MSVTRIEENRYELFVSEHKRDHSVLNRLHPAVLTQNHDAAVQTASDILGVDAEVAAARLATIERDYLVWLTAKNPELVALPPLMTMPQFEVLATLRRSIEPARTAAMLVLVLGWAQIDARRALAVERKTQSVWNAVARFKEDFEMVKKAFPHAPTRKELAADPPQLTPEQFNAVAALIRSREPAQSAARLVLVYGQGKSQAAKEANILTQSCWNTVQRFKRALTPIREAFPGA